MKNIVLTVLVLMVASRARAIEIPKMQILAENWAPYNFVENHKVQGFAVELLDGMLKRAGSRQGVEDVKIYPWARAYRIVQDEKNTILFTATRTEEREKLFKWVCSINTLKTEMIALKSSKIRISTVDDLKQYRIGAIRDGSSEQNVVNKGGVPLDQIQRVTTMESNVMKLVAGRIDLYASSMANMRTYSKRMNLDVNQFESVITLDESHLCFAFNKNTADEVVEAFQKAFDSLVKDGSYDQLYNRYFD